MFSHTVLSLPSYRAARERKRQWYGDGYADRFVTSEDGPDGSIDAARIEWIAWKRILEENRRTEEDSWSFGS